ncbi:MAG: Rieske (2Fe-2S) protein [Alphaproteobacteria bacterium]|nr:Rieske (2Fe-2S) protein [Alphaproteobacteria bacterium]
MTFLCRLSDLEPTGARGVVLADGRDIIVVRSDDGIRAFTNACPHQGVPLETFPDRFLDADRKLIVCSAHGARFRPADGLCTAGPCRGKHLPGIPIVIVDGAIEMADAADA